MELTEENKDLRLENTQLPKEREEHWGKGEENVRN